MIVGLGLLGGRYALGLTRAGFAVDGIDRSPEAVEFALKEGYIQRGAAENFAPLAKAYSIPKDDPTRAEVLEKVTVAACDAPMEMMRWTCKAVDLLAEMLDKGSVTLVSDVGCGALCCEAALESASMNVFVNTKTLQDREVAGKLESEADEMLRVYGVKARQVADEVTRRLRSK